MNRIKNKRSSTTDHINNQHQIRKKKNEIQRESQRTTLRTGLKCSGIDPVFRPHKPLSLSKFQVIIGIEKQTAVCATKQKVSSILWKTYWS